MNFNSSTSFKWLFLTIWSVLIYVYLLKVFQPELYYHFQQPPFIFDWNFLNTFIIFPGGFSQYLSNILTQFFFYGWAGSLVIMMLGLLMMFLTQSIFKSINVNKSSGILMYIPFVLLIAVTNNYHLPYVVIIKMAILFVMVWLFRFLSVKKMNAYLLLVIMVPVTYYLAGSGILMLFAATILMINFINYESLKNSLVFSAFTVIYTYSVAFFCYKYIFSINADEAYFSIYPDLPNFMKYYPGVFYYLFCYCLPSILLLILIYKRFMQKPVTDKITGFSKKFHLNALAINTITGCVILISSYFIFGSTMNTHKKNIIKADYYCYNEKWKDVINLAATDTAYDVFINYNYNRAIDNSGNFLKLFFNYPQYMGLDAIYPDKINVPELSEISSDYYFDLGYISESQHWAYEALTIFPYSIRVLKRLVLTNLIYGNYEGAREYLEVLNKNFLANDFVEKYRPYVEDTTLATKDSLILQKRSFMPGYAHLSDSITNRFYDLLAKNDNNRRAYEHLQLGFLLDLNLGQFMSVLSSSCKFYKHTPELYEQGIMMYLLFTDIKKISRFKLSTNSQKTFSGYLKTLHESNDNKEIAKPLLKKYSDTYIYYTAYNCPLVTNAALTKENEQKY